MTLRVLLLAANLAYFSRATAADFVEFASVDGEDTTNSEYWRRQCQNVPDNSADYIRMTMGEYVDFFKPTEGATFCDMLLSNKKHLWSTDGKNWVKLKPYISDANLGGSGERPPDGRSYISFWGTDYPRAPQNAGGCCHLRPDDNHKWRLPFKLEYHQIPSTTTFTATSTTSTGTVFGLLHRRISDLENMDFGADLKAGLALVIKAVDEVESALVMQTAAQAAINTEKDARLNALEAAVQQMQSAGKAQKVEDETQNKRIDELKVDIATIFSPLERREPLVDPSRCQDKAACPPNVMSDGNGGLSMSAVGGSITLESAECGVTDLCGLARDFQALMARLGGE